MRQIIYTLLFILALLLSPLHAENVPQDTSVKELIEKVKRSSGDARRKAMNALKIKLRTVNRESRIAVMQDLRKSFSSSSRQRKNPHSEPSFSRQQMQQQMGIQRQSTIQMQMKPGGTIPEKMKSPVKMPHNNPNGGGYP